MQIIEPKIHIEMYSIAYKCALNAPFAMEVPVTSTT
ncbi:hypothetical protein SAMN05216389_11483 [Oceanobacillus limi]|uniref:Uncharacterized protein n=1 Tax=Oceanobacillus limi TaxID=930131 RepID=A0A1I0FAI4_9BACI|nr:hypothetical protein SAMN05216389_11483 [Oceanobacillus limi]